MWCSNTVFVSPTQLLLVVRLDTQNKNNIIITFASKVKNNDSGSARVVTILTGWLEMADLSTELLNLLNDHRSL
jgi:hypothetical protein